MPDREMSQPPVPTEIDAKHDDLDDKILRKLSEEESPKN
jgi:hypothetical protein